MKAVWDSIIRTVTPIVVGHVVGWFASAGIIIDSEFAPSLTLLVGSVLSAVYYIGVRLLETYANPRFGWLLGLAKAPEYVDKQG